MKHFMIGFEKRALRDTRLGEDAVTAGTALLPYGAALRTGLREDRDGHRLGDFGARLLGNVAGAAIGRIPGKLTGDFGATLLGAAAGAIAGEVIADRLRTKGLYDKDGKLIPKDKRPEGEK